jgi:hypothetical protein
MAESAFGLADSRTHRRRADCVRRVALMVGPLVLVLVAGAVRLVSGVAWAWLGTLRDRGRRRSLEALTRAAGPGATLVDHCPDGGTLAIWTCGPPKGHHQDGGAR